MMGKRMGWGGALAGWVVLSGWAATADAQTTFNPGRDTYVDSSTTGTTTQFGNSDRLSVERASSGLNERSYIHFDVSSLAGQTVTVATMRLWIIRENSGGSALDRYEIYEVLSPWTDSLTWDQSQGLSIGPLFLQLDSLDYGTANTVSPPQPVDFDVTGLVQGWVAGGTNEGILIQLENTASADIRFASMQNPDTTIHPQLIVTTGGTPPPPPPPPPPGPGPGPTGGVKKRSDDDGTCGCGSIASVVPSPIWIAVLAPLGLLLFRRR